MYKYVVAIALVGTGILVSYFLFVSNDNLQTVNIPEVTYEEASKEDSSIPSLPADQNGERNESKDLRDELADEDSQEEVEKVLNEDDEVEEVDSLPAQFNLAVPFTSQAPHADWSLPFQEACEEASAYMVSAYLAGVPSGKIDPTIATKEILDVVDFQKDFLGHYLDTTAEETVRFIDAFYGYGVIVVDDPSVEMIKAEIAAGRPVIVPAAGKQLDNPFFSGEGPLYHMFVIKGYTEDKFIVNDPGTRNGENYVYDISVVMSAMGDWNNGKPEEGAKRVIFLMQ